MNFWIFFALLAPLLLAITDTLTKKAYHTLDEYTLAWFRNLFSLPVLFFFLFHTGIPTVSPSFWKILPLVIPIELVVTVLYFRAIKVSPISHTAPFGAFSPLFISVGSYLFLGESIKSNLVLPILLLVAGAYIINLSISKKIDLLEPIRAFGKEKGPIFMIIAGFLFGITNPVGKLLVEYSSPQFYTAVYFGTATALFTPIFLTQTSDTLKNIKGKLPLLFTVGIFNGLFLITMWLAYSLGPLGPISALVKLSILFTILIAGFHLKESEIKGKTVASLFMIAGAVLIVLLA